MIKAGDGIIKEQADGSLAFEPATAADVENERKYELQQEERRKGSSQLPHAMDFRRESGEKEIQKQK